MLARGTAPVPTNAGLLYGVVFGCPGDCEYVASVGAGNVGGATVSTLNANGVRSCTCGAVSWTVRVCGPSASGVDTGMSVLPHTSDTNDPIAVPSILAS